MPFFQTAATAAGSRVLRDKDRMAAHGRLFAVIRDKGGREPLCDQLGGVAAHGLPSPVADILAVLQAETEAAAEARARKRGGDLRIAHGVFCESRGSSCLHLAKQPESSEEYSACTGTHTQSVFGNLHKKQLAYTLSVVYNYKQGSNPINKRPCDRQG